MHWSADEPATHCFDEENCDSMRISRIGPSDPRYAQPAGPLPIGPPPTRIGPPDPVAPTAEQAISRIDAQFDQKYRLPDAIPDLSQGIRIHNYPPHIEKSLTELALAYGKCITARDEKSALLGQLDKDRTEAQNDAQIWETANPGPVTKLPKEALHQLQKIVKRTEYVQEQIDQTSHARGEIAKEMHALEATLKSEVRSDYSSTQLILLSKFFNENPDQVP